jgi:hypothetical protein
MYSKKARCYFCVNTLPKFTDYVYRQNNDVHRHTDNVSDLSIFTNTSIMFTDKPIMYTDTSILYTDTPIMDTDTIIIYTDTPIIYTNGVY